MNNNNNEELLIDVPWVLETPFGLEIQVGPMIILKNKLY